MVQTYDPIIEVIEEDYEIPHLGATRRITALLPHDYKDTNKSYPVLYLQDGQNLFNPHAPFGDWAIDKSMAKMAALNKGDLIIIAIDHGDKERIQEYLPYYHPKFGSGKGKYYIRFMKEKLIPYVNRKYRTLTDYGNTGIGGSSMGGLISLYAGLSHPEIFGRLMIFSPSLWVSNKIFAAANSFHPLEDTRIYIYAGAKESKYHLPNIKRLESILTAKIHSSAYVDFELSVNEDGTHSELYWGQEFPRAIKWLFYNEKT